MKRLADVLGDVTVQTIVGDPDAAEVSGVVHDSRAVTAGALFCCVRGATVDGHDLAPQARDAGAAALLCERVLPVDLPQVVVAS
ncbi:MAG: UDP-N-acetylmuramoyl-L-alanyl-D-glutamate--2,6-diaminopimelate ligase, partial [Acidimicrobiaceae bacterium]